MYYTGFADEAGKDIDAQIRATKELGWNCIESRNIDGMNIHDLSDADFDLVAEKLDKSGVKINCFGSTIANWRLDPRSDEDNEKTEKDLKRALLRMERLGCTMIRGMSFTRLRDASLYTEALEKKIFTNVNKLVRLCEEAGVDYMHENCANYGGMSSDHTLKLLDNVKSPNFKLVFDTGNPVNSIDYRKGQNGKMQSAWQFYNEVKEFVTYVHIKDGRFLDLKQEETFNNTEWTFAGEGEGFVKEIIADLLKDGYDGGFSMEPHMKLVYHESEKRPSEEMKFDNYVEYGRRFMTLVDQIKQTL